jgi:hypothetical protein
VGDAVMAASGIPLVHEDGALRFGTAADMRERLARPIDEPEQVIAANSEATARGP